MRQRLLPNGFLTAVVAALLLGSPWVSAAGADAAQVTVVSPGGSQQTLALDALGGDVASRAYALRSAEGESTVTVSGFSPAAILDAAGADPYGFSYLEVQRAAGGSVLLSRAQALDPGAFPDGPPVIYATGTGTAFLRPSSGPEDLNASDSFEAPQGLTIVLGKGQPVQVRAQASTVRTRPGQSVDFSAIVTRAGAGEKLSYSWYFDDGHSASGKTASHSFAKRGSYDVIVGVTTPGDDAGASDVITVQVGAPLAGPNRKGGGTNEDAGAPDHGVASGSGSASGGPPGTATAAPGPAGEQRPPSRQQPKPSPAAGEPVSGELLSTTAAAAEATPKAAARTGKLDGDGGGGGVPGAALGILTTLGLLGLGALVEVRGIGNLLPGRL